MSIESNTKILVGSEEERAVSPVIGVILMVAITVILAAVIAAFVLDIGPGAVEPTAAVEVNEGTESATVELTSIDNGDGIAILATQNENGFEDGETITTTGGEVSVDSSDAEDGEWTVVAYDGDTPGSSNTLPDLQNNDSITIVIEEQFELDDG